MPSANGPDIYVQETCPEGTFVRAITDDGRELWRRNISLPINSRPAAFNAKAEAQPGVRLDLNAHSLCDDISNGMTKDAVTKLAQERDLRLAESWRLSNRWEFEEHGFRCNVSFGAAQEVVKKKKVIITD